jgi:hypothetical protein
MQLVSKQRIGKHIPAETDAHNTSQNQVKVILRPTVSRPAGQSVLE